MLSKGCCQATRGVAHWCGISSFWDGLLPVFMFVSFVPGCLTYRALGSLFGLYPVPCWGPFLLVAWAVEQCLFLWILLSPGAHHGEVLFLAVYHPSGLLVVVYHDTALPQCFFWSGTYPWVIFNLVPWSGRNPPCSTWMPHIFPLPSFLVRGCTFCLDLTSA